MTIQKIRSGRINTVVAEEYVGEHGTIFYNENIGDLRLSDGTTIGGIPLTFGSGGNGYTGSIGYTGSTGYTGSIGSQGPIGYVGSVGVGYTGSAGSGAGSLTVGTINGVTTSTFIGINTLRFDATGFNLTDLGSGSLEIAAIAFGNIDGGYPNSVYGGIANIDAGGI
jgi:hypothetical protein